MRRATVTIPDELEQALETYRRDAEIPPGVSAVMQAALREYLTGRGYVKPREGGGSDGPEERSWPRYPLYSGDPTLADTDEEALASGPGTPPFGER